MEHKKGFYEKYIKRPQDFLLSLFAIVIFSPLLVVLAILVRVKLGTPVIFVQDRVGKDEKTFKLYKFRTMTDKKDCYGNLLPDEERLTRLGKILRMTSLDELPELFNIIKGDMCFIGPRPLLVEYLPYYNDIERMRHSVRPGLSGLAQVNGRSFISWEEIFDLDVKYSQNITFLGDMNLIFKTFLKVVKRDDVANVSDVEEGEDGELYVRIDGTKVRLHRPLNIEREGRIIAE